MQVGELHERREGKAAGPGLAPPRWLGPRGTPDPASLLRQEGGLQFRETPRDGRRGRRPRDPGKEAAATGDLGSIPGSSATQAAL